jgi:acyl-CoA thioesterase-2
VNPILKHIIDLLNVEELEQNLYRGQNHQTEHVFGGQVLAQAIAAGFRTVDADHDLHSIHSYFIRPGDWNVPIIYEVDRIRDGRSFTTRRVMAVQHGRAIFEMALSWHKAEPGIEHTLPMPDVPPPEALRGDREVFAEHAKNNPDFQRFSFRFEAIDSRQVERIPMDDQDTHPPINLDFMSTSMLPHGRNLMRGQMHGASLDHSLWFHRPFRADEWLLFAKESPNAGGARGFVRGQFFNRAGDLVVTAAQECLIRQLKPQAAAG